MPTTATLDPPDRMPIWARLLLADRRIPFAHVTGFRIAETGRVIEIHTPDRMRRFIRPA